MTLLSRKKVVIFDFDGTIVDSMNSFAKIASEVMPRHYSIDKDMAKKQYLKTSGIPFFEQLEVIFPGHPSNTKASNEFETIKKESYFTREVYHDTAETLRALKQKGITVIVSSNNFQDLVDAFVKKTGIEFDMVLGYRKNFAKGADHFKYIMNELGCTRDEMAFVGDSIKDGERAADFGVDFIGKEGIFSRNEFQKSFPASSVISNLSDLKGMF